MHNSVSVQYCQRSETLSLSGPQVGNLDKEKRKALVQIYMVPQTIVNEREESFHLSYADSSITPFLKIRECLSLLSSQTNLAAHEE